MEHNVINEKEATEEKPFPAESTAYISNLAFSLTVNDLYKIFGKYGKIVTVTIVKDKKRRSRGIAFIYFLKVADALKCISECNGTKMFGRIIKCSIANDNGRSIEFMKKRIYPDNSRCYECGKEGHLSYTCPENVLGDRDVPERKKIRTYTDKSKNNKDLQNEDYINADFDESLDTAIKFEQKRVEEENIRQNIKHGNKGDSEITAKKRRIKQSSYFSDEEEEVN